MKGTHLTVAGVILTVMALSHCSLLAGTYGGGAGTAEDPYQIGTAVHWQELTTTAADWDQQFILTADIDLSGLTFTQAPVAPDTNNASAGFQGTPFTGVFDGNGHTVSNLTIDASTQDDVGLFGCLGSGSQIRNLGVENVNITGRYYVGGLVGWNYSGTLTSCYATGSVTGTDLVGGLVGYNSGTLTSCYATGSVSGTGTDVGGLVRYNYGTLTSCYATGSVSGTDYVGGLVGFNDFGTLTSCYATGSVSGTGYVGGLVGENEYGTLNSCFWDTQTSGRTVGVGSGTSTGVTGKTTAEMKTLSTFTDAGWDFVGESANGLNDYWEMPVDGYPHFALNTWTLSGEGAPDNPYIVAGAGDLGKVWLRPSACYRLDGNLDLTGISWSSAVVPAFAGVFDGQGFVISNLTINQPGSDKIGLFGHVYAGGRIRNLGVENVNITGRRYVGGLVGRNYFGTLTSCYATGSVGGTGSYVGGLVGDNIYGTLTSCYATGSVSGTGSYVGGLVGYNYDGTLTSCYATGSVSGTDYVGGLVGYNHYGSLTECYATGLVSGTDDVGGLVGLNSSGAISSCFWDTQTSALSIGVGSGMATGVTGKTTAQMKTLATFTDAEWDFVGTWVICEGTNYPRLQWQVGAADWACPDGVGMEDLVYLCERWLGAGPEAAGAADANGDGRISFADYAILAEHWLTGE